MRNLWALLLLSFILPYGTHSFNLIIGGEATSYDVGNNVGGGFTNVRFAFQYALQEGVVTHQADVESLLCRTQDYLANTLNDEFLEANLKVKATGIIWSFVQGDDMAVKVNFTASVTASNGTEVPEAKDIKDATSNLDMGAYLTEYVQQSECPTAFSQATKAAYENMLTPEIKGDLEEATCESTCAPTFTPGTPTCKYSSCLFTFLLLCYHSSRIDRVVESFK